MSTPAVWRVEALGLPRLSRRCIRCRRDACLEPTGRFRVNAQKSRLDVWLLFRCATCGAGTRVRIARRASVADLGRDLPGYERDDARLVRRCAFAQPDVLPVPYRLIRAPLPARGVLHARIFQPEPCGVRWDRLLADALGSRGAVRRAWRDARLRIDGVRALSQRVRDAQQLRLVLDAKDAL